MSALSRKSSKNPLPLSEQFGGLVERDGSTARPLSRIHPSRHSNGAMVMTITASATSPVAMLSGIPTAGLSKNGRYSRLNVLTNFISFFPFKLSRWNRTAGGLGYPCRAPSISLSAYVDRVRSAVPLAGSPQWETRWFGGFQSVAGSAKRLVQSYSGSLDCLPLMRLSNPWILAAITTSATSEIGMHKTMVSVGFPYIISTMPSRASRLFISLTSPYVLARWIRTAGPVQSPCRASSISSYAYVGRVRFAVPLAGSPLREHRWFGRIQGAVSAAGRLVKSYSGGLARLPVIEPLQAIADGWRSLQNLTRLGHSLEGFTNGLFDRNMRLDNGFHPAFPSMGGMIKRGGGCGISPSRTRGFRQRNCCPNPDSHKSKFGSSGGFPTPECEANS